MLKLLASLVAGSAIFVGGLFSGCGIVVGGDGSDAQSTVPDVITKGDIASTSFTIPTSLRTHTFPPRETTVQR